MQYVDYTLWQRAQLGDIDDSDSRIAAQLAYWEEALAGMPERLQLPTDRPYPPVADYRGAEWRWTGRPSCSSGLPGWLASTMRPVSWWCKPPWRCCCPRSAPALMWRWRSRSPAAATRALDDLVGFFVNTLVLRVDLAGDPTVAELLAQVRGRSLAAYEHQDVPFEVLVERLNPTRTLTHHPLVQVMLAWQN